MRLERKIREILNDTLSAEIITYYPTKADKKRNPYVKPGAEQEVVGIDKAVKEIMKLIEEKETSTINKKFVKNIKQNQ